MLTSSEFKELLSIFSDHKVRFLIVGGYAVMKYSEQRCPVRPEPRISRKGR
jgi:hypothetical protein